MVNRNCFILLAVIIFSGCAAHPRVPSVVMEQRLIQPNQEITILWDIQTGCGAQNGCAMGGSSIYSNIYSKQYEVCTNSYYEKTFSRNGYKAKVLKVNKADISTVSIDTQYVLVLHNDSTLVYGNSWVPTKALVQLHLNGKLYDGNSGKLLWQGESHLEANAKRNFHPAIQIVRALADDGFLNLKVNDVVDYEGGHPVKDMDIPETCPD